MADTDPWVGSTFGAEPLIQQLEVAAGSSTAIVMGDMCKLDVIGTAVAPVASASDNLHAIVIAKEAQISGQAARLMDFYIPRLGDFFNFALDAATVIEWGDELQIDAAQALKKSTTDAVAWAAKVLAPITGTTWSSVSRVTAMFQLANKASAGKELPFVGALLGDAS